MLLDWKDFRAEHTSFEGLFFWLKDKENGQPFTLSFVTPLSMVIGCGLSHNSAGNFPNPSETNRENHHEHFGARIMSFGNEYFKLLL